MAGRAQQTAFVETSFVEKTVAAAGFEVRYLEAGEGAPLVCLPGAGGPVVTPALELLSQQFRVLVIELPGWGPQPNDVADFDGLADQVADVIAALGLDAYHLLGTSLGGACALHLVTRYPERVISLTVEAPGEFRPGAVPPNELPPEDFVRAFRSHPERPPAMAPPDPAFMARVWPTVERLMGDGTPNADFLARLSQVRTRTLVLFGRDDGIIPPENGRLYRQAMPNCALIYVYDAAHDIQSDRPEAFADVVADFVRRGMNFLVNDTDQLINP